MLIESLTAGLIHALNAVIIVAVFVATVSDTIGAAIIAAIASLVNTVLLLLNQRQIRDGRKDVRQGIRSAEYVARTVKESHNDLIDALGDGQGRKYEDKPDGDTHKFKPRGEMPYDE